MSRFKKKRVVRIIGISGHYGNGLLSVTDKTDADIQSLIDDWLAVDDVDRLDNQVPLLEYLCEFEGIKLIEIDSKIEL